MNIRPFAPVLGLALGVLASAATQAQSLLNGSFETGDFTGWTRSGFYISSGGPTTGGPVFATFFDAKAKDPAKDDTNAVVASQTAAFDGLGVAGAAINPTNGGFLAFVSNETSAGNSTLTGSSISQTFTVPARATFLTADVLLLNDDSSGSFVQYDDFGGVALTQTDGTVVAQYNIDLDSASAADAHVAVSATGGFKNSTPFKQVSFDVSALVGQTVTFTAYSLTYGGDNAVETRLLLDNVAVGQTPAPQPTVTLTQPATNATVVSGAPLTLAATVNDPGAVLSKVEFFFNTVSAGSVATPGPYTLATVAPAPGAYTVQAVATDTLGRQSTSSRTLTVLTPAPQPTVVISSPPTDVTVVSGSALPLAASVTDPGGILTRVNFLLNGAPVGFTTAVGPYLLNATAPAPGVYTLQAVAVDNLGRQNTSTRIVTVVAADPANPAPRNDLLSGELDGRSLAGGSIVEFVVSAESGDPDVPLARVDFYADGVLFASYDGDNNPLPPFTSSGHEPTRAESNNPLKVGSVFVGSYPMPGASKLITMLAVAVDKLGRAQASQSISVTSVANVADRPPAVTLKGLRTGARVKVNQTITLPVDATDPDAASPSGASRAPVPRAFDISPLVAKVEYFVNGLRAKSDDAQAPYSLDFKPTAAGAYVVRAIATDGAGLAAITKAVIAEAIPAPTVSLSVAGAGLAAEGGATGKVLVLRAGDTRDDLTVFYKAVGTAKSGTDYTALTGQIVIPAGATKAKIKIKPVDDSIPHDERKVKIKLVESPTGDYEMGSGGKAKILFLDND